MGDPGVPRAPLPVRLPETWRIFLVGLTFVGCAVTCVGFVSAASFLGDTTYAHSDMRRSLQVGCAGLPILGLALSLWWAERRGRLVFLSSVVEADLVRDRRLRPPPDDRSKEPLRAPRTRDLERPVRQLHWAAKALVICGMASWGVCVVAVLLGVSGALAVWTGMGGLLLSTGGFAASLAGVLVRTARVLRADSELRDDEPPRGG